MSRLEWCPKMYSAGDIDGAGLRKLLGASHHAPLALLVRETIQNSWDASRRDDGSPLFGEPPRWTFELRHLTATEAEGLRSSFSTLDVPGTTLAEALSGDVRVFEISDRRTVGLGGPLHYDEAIPPGVPTDFIDLVYNVGAPQDTAGGGGTYGFGKIAAFGVSECATVLYRTQPLVGERPGDSPSPRLIGSTVGDHFNLDGRRYTGRHWWGRNDDGHPRPIVGNDVDDLAAELFRHDFAERDTGTSILVVQPQLDGMAPEAVVKHIVDAVLWNAWPKLIPREEGAQPPMLVDVRLDGEVVEVPDPAELRPFSGFASALHAVRSSIAGHGETEPRLEGNTVDVSRHEFRSGNPARLVGHVAVARCFAPGVEQVEDEAHLDVYSPAGFRGASRHLALMREPELIVTYLEGPPAGPGMEWCGVFRPCPELDRHFAEAEPPSHDDWLVGRVEDRSGKIFVKRGRQHGPRELFRELFTPVGRANASGPTRSLAHIADQLGHLVGQGQRPTKGGARSRSSGGSRGDVRILGSRPVALPDGTGGVMVDFEVPRQGMVTVEASVGLAGGSSDSSLDVADRQPFVLGITKDSATSPPDSQENPVALSRGTWRAWVANAGRVTVSTSIRFQSEQDV